MNLKIKYKKTIEHELIINEEEDDDVPSIEFDELSIYIYIYIIYIKIIVLLNFKFQIYSSF